MATFETITRSEVEDFLYEEAALLDRWDLDGWRALFVPEGRYLVPATGMGPDANPETSLFLISDDGHHLTERINRLKKRTAYAENPRSTTRHLISNVRILERTADRLRVESSFVTYRTNQGESSRFWGSHLYVLIGSPSDMRIAEKRTTLDMEVLRPQGKLTIIV